MKQNVKVGNTKTKPFEKGSQPIFVHVFNISANIVKDFNLLKHWNKNLDTNTWR